MATSSTLKTLKEQDGPIDQRDAPALVRPSSRSGRIQTWWRSIWRRRWLSVTTAWAICLVGWAVITLWPTSYIASAVVHADLAKLADNDKKAEGAAGTPVSMLKTLLLSEASLEEVRRRVDLDAAKDQTLKTDLMLRSTVPPVFVVAYEHVDPDMAKQVVEALIAGYRARLEERARLTAQMARSVNEQVEDHQRRLQTIEADMVTFRRDNADYLESGEDKAAELALLEEEWESLQQQVKATTSDRDTIAAKLARARGAEAGAEPPRSRAALEAERKALTAELTKLQDRYADTHPYVVAVFDAINALDIEVGALEAAAGDDSAGGLPLDREALEQRHGELIFGVSTLNSQLRDKQREIEQLQALTRTATSVEAELSGLEAEKKELASALSDLQQSRRELGDGFGGEATQEAFRLIKQPELPTDPVGPSRLMALAAVLFGGTGAGAAAAVFCNRVKGVFESAWQLKQRFDVGVLGTISEVMTPAERKSLGQRRLAFGLAFLALIGTFGGLVVAELTDSLAPFGDQVRTQLLG